MVLKNCFLLGVFLVLLSCSGQPEMVSDSDSTYSPDGELLFLNNCAACHGVDGKLGAGNAFDLSTTQLDTEQMREVILKGRNAMPPFESILKDTAEIDAIIKHIQTLEN